MYWFSKIVLNYKKRTASNVSTLPKKSSYNNLTCGEFLCKTVTSRLRFVNLGQWLTTTTLIVKKQVVKVVVDQHLQQTEQVGFICNVVVVTFCFELCHFYFIMVYLYSLIKKEEYSFSNFISSNNHLVWKKVVEFKQNHITRLFYFIHAVNSF